MTKRNEEEETKQIHIRVPITLHERLRAAIPEWGNLSSLLRSFIRRYVEALEGNDASAFDHAASDVINETNRASGPITSEGGKNDA